MGDTKIDCLLPAEHAVALNYVVLVVALVVAPVGDAVVNSHSQVST